MGGGGRIDHPYNLVSSCSLCHHLTHQGKVSKIEWLSIVSKREKIDPDKIVEFLLSIRNAI
jgi:hypothetical protein